MNHPTHLLVFLSHLFLGAIVIMKTQNLSKDLLGFVSAASASDASFKAHFKLLLQYLSYCGRLYPECMSQKEPASVRLFHYSNSKVTKRRPYPSADMMGP